MYYQTIINQISRQNPLPENIDEEAHKFIAYPEVAGHPTGGAVDVTLQHLRTELDMGGKIADFSQPDLIATFSAHANKQQKENRMVLLSVMRDQGFSPFYGEWWHFSFGDKEWAWFYKQ